MVAYWKTKGAVEAKVTTENGVSVMRLEGEKYTFPGFPRGYLLYGKLSKLKHEIKNQIFNDLWKKLEEKMPEEKIISELRSNTLPIIFKYLDWIKYDVVPFEGLVSPLKELYRAWDRVSSNKNLRDLIVHILQEDDSYRFRFQWVAQFLSRWGDPIKNFEDALVFMEHAEVIEDMKERIRLFRRILMMLLRDEHIKKKFTALYKEINWKKIRLSNADKYYFRGKYFKVDLDKFEY